METQLFHWIYGWLHRPPWFSVIGWWTHLGDPKFVFICGTLGALHSAMAWVKRGKQKALPPLIPWLGILLSIGATQWLKQVVGRPRPSEAIPALGLIVTDPGHAFPSGHATLAFALAAVLTLRWPKGRFLWWAAALGVGLSRIGLGVHWPSDVVAGAVIGAGVVLGLAWVERNFMRST